MPDIIAHRGFSKKAPENTLSSIRLAIEQSVNFIEIDVHLSKDGVPVVIHDALLGRTTCSKEPVRITEMTFKSIKKLDAGSWFDFYYKGEEVPSLKEVLDLNFGSTGLMIEIKKGHSPVKPLTTAVGKLVRTALSSSKFNQILIGSFSHQILKEMRIQFPSLPLIGIADDFNTLLPIISLKLPYMAIWHKLATPTLINTIHQNNTKVWAFTVDCTDRARDLDEMDIDGIITNDPETMLLNFIPSEKKLG